MSDRSQVISQKGRQAHSAGIADAQLRAARAACNRRLGFTLVELLVVIGIVTLLISILLPTLSSARHAAYVIRWKAYMNQLKVDPDVIALYDFQVDGADMAADANGNINNSSLILENKAVGDPSDRLSTTPSNLNGVFAGTLTANPAQNPTWVEGRWNGKGALRFSGTQKQFVDCGASRDWSRISTGVTMAIWFKPLDTSSGTLVGREYGRTHVFPYYSWLAFDSGGTPQMRIDQTTAQGKALRVNDWNHVVYTFGDAGGNGVNFMNVFQDDVKAGYNMGTNSGHSNVQSSVQNVRIGSGAGSAVSNVSPPDPLTGVIDEIVIFNKVMPDYGNPFNQEIDKLYQVGLAARQ